MSNQDPNSPFLWPKWIDTLKVLFGALLLIHPAYATILVWYGGSPKTADVGYAPVQPVPYSHALHAGQLGIDCRYCHNTVEVAAHASIPPTQTCMNCHTKIRATSPKLVKICESAATGMPVPWVRIHDLPERLLQPQRSRPPRGGVRRVPRHLNDENRMAVADKRRGYPSTARPASIQLGFFEDEEAILPPKFHRLKTIFRDDDHTVGVPQTLLHQVLRTDFAAFLDGLQLSLL